MAIFELVKSPKVKCLLMTEALARCVKHILEEKYELWSFYRFLFSSQCRWRRLESHGEESYLHCAITLFNQLFSIRDRSTSIRLFDEDLSRELFVRFMPCNLPAEGCNYTPIYSLNSLSCGDANDRTGVSTAQFRESPTAPFARLTANRTWSKTSATRSPERFTGTSTRSYCYNLIILRAKRLI